jgi:predicted porin
MKKALIALAALGLTGAAVAQSSVTLFGVVDLAARYTKGGGQDVSSLVSGGQSTSRFGVRGTEDLGGGLKAGFWLESQVNADSGGAGSSNGAYWGRRATISLSGDFGEVRLGRNKVATKLAYEDFDPTSATGLGSIETLYKKLGTPAIVDYGRFDNLVSYSLPSNLGGFYGQIEAAAGEGTSLNKMYAGRVGYKEGVLNVSAAYMEAGASTKYKFMTFGGSYDLGVVKPSLVYTVQEYGSQKQNVWTAAVTAPLGQGLIWASYSNSSDESDGVAQSALKANMLAAGYTHNLSKRTALYTSVALLDNGAKATFNLNGAPTQTAPKADGKAGGVDVGIRHSF